MNFCPDIIEIVGLSYLVPESSSYWHCLYLDYDLFTCRFMVAPDSRSPNFSRPVVI